MFPIVTIVPREEEMEDATQHDRCTVTQDRRKCNNSIEPWLRGGKVPTLSCPNPASGGEKKPASTKHQSTAPHRSHCCLSPARRRQQLYGDPAARHIRNEASRASVHLSPAVLHPGPAAPEQGHGPPQQRPSIIG
ncbi:hypothetical protein KUCAC02_011139 [Chaenocephalus aceratus]|uniref:Uncharacterized protein n=1 Tax=Chaenocephalus aceratus TaxID=36190 RepID=A0ACB9WWM0_CHAAC|nr:hypothetical protein KUCAC02_011139 [Chaenocephalus aceratus]